VFVPTMLLMDLEWLPGDDWTAAPEHDGWWIPEAEYLRLVGRVN
jgi:hypothetical protein